MPTRNLIAIALMGIATGLAIAGLLVALGWWSSWVVSIGLVTAYGYALYTHA